jgi:hypothetical protein
LETVTDFGQFSRCEVNALLLGIRPLSRAVSTLAKPFQLARHLLDLPSEIRQLASDARYVFAGCHICRILCSERNGPRSCQRLRGPREHHEVSLERDSLEPAYSTRRKPVLVLEPPELPLRLRHGPCRASATASSHTGKPFDTSPRTGDISTGTPVTNFRRSNRLYRIAMSYNRGLDRDKDRIACEKR